MTNMTATKPVGIQIEEQDGFRLAAKLRSAVGKISAAIPSAVVIALIALYYISMSHLGA